MAKINYIKRWKYQLESDSEHNRMRVIALMEMVTMLNDLDQKSAEPAYELLIDSDICHFIAEIMSYRDRSTLVLINKIVCHLSEVHRFYENDFFRFFKGYTRVLNFLPKAKMEKDEDYHEDIFKSINLIVKR